MAATKPSRRKIEKHAGEDVGSQFLSFDLLEGLLPISRRELENPMMAPDPAQGGELGRGAWSPPRSVASKGSFCGLTVTGLVNTGNGGATCASWAKCLRP